MQGVELNLKHVHDVGIYGWGSVCETIIGEWLEDISQNQVLMTFATPLENCGHLANSSLFVFLYLVICANILDAGT